jgi:hypothetical protein
MSQEWMGESRTLSAEEHDELRRLGDPLYEKLKALVGPEHARDYIAIHVDTGEYAVAPSSFEASIALLAGRKPDGRLYIRRLNDEPNYSLAARILAGDMSTGTRK